MKFSHMLVVALLVAASPPPSAVTAASSGATNADGGTSDATSALSNNLAEAARAVEELKQSFKRPSLPPRWWVTVNE